jgi:uncharacterized protein (TIGR03790 family)
MAISKDNVIFVYNSADLDSIAVAAHYANAHDLDTSSDDPSGNSGAVGGINWEVNGQLVGIEITDSSEILLSEASFNEQLLNPLKYALDNATELSGRAIWAVVLGYNVPGGFLDGSNVVSSTSRISRIHHSFSKKKSNKLYNRSIFSRFGSSDASVALICSRIDAPSVYSAKAIIDNASRLNEQRYVYGKFYIDPYSDRVGPQPESYTEEMERFKDNLLPSLNLDSWSTTFMDPYIDVSIPYVQDDSFVWSWFRERGSSSFFKTTNSRRVFFYNADYDGGYSIRDETTKRWPYLALSAGYATTVGAMSNPSVAGFINPTPFFEALLRGACVGEAYLFSLPYLDWTMALFGDPLAYCSFPSMDVDDEDVIDEHEVWLRNSKDLARAIAQLYKKGKELEAMQTKIVDLASEDGDVELALLYPANYLWKASGDTARRSQFKNLVETFFDFPVGSYYNVSSGTLSPSTDLYLTDRGFRISRLLPDILGNTESFSSANLLPEGWWQFEFIVQDDSSDYVYYRFVLEVASDADFSTILLTKDSNSIRNWTYEKSKDTFIALPSGGISSSFIGRRIRYESRYEPLLGIDEYLARGETYYFRVTQYNADTGEQYSERTYSDIIYT